MSDQMAVRGIRAWGRGGVNPGERDVAQPFDIDVELDVDFERSCHTDSLADTLDYRSVHEKVVEVVRTTQFGLIERLAQEIARQILHDDRVRAVTVTVAKPEILSGATPSITLRRRR